MSGIGDANAAGGSPRGMTKARASSRLARRIAILPGPDDRQPRETLQRQPRRRCRPVTRGRVHRLAAIGAVAVLIGVLILTERPGWPAFALAAFTYFGLLWALAPRVTPRGAELPPGLSREEYAAALDALATARRELSALVVLAPHDDVAMIRRMGELVEAIRRHHVASPAHVARTRSFVRHTLGRMVAAVAGYVDLSKRAGPDRDERLAAVARQLAGFLPVLEKIDRACVENDLLALEVNVEVLNDQLGRDREV